MAIQEPRRAQPRLEKVRILGEGIARNVWCRRRPGNGLHVFIDVVEIGSEALADQVITQAAVETEVTAQLHLIANTHPPLILQLARDKVERRHGRRSALRIEELLQIAPAGDGAWVDRAHRRARVGRSQEVNRIRTDIEESHVRRKRRERRPVELVTARERQQVLAVGLLVELEAAAGARAARGLLGVGDRADARERGTAGGIALAENIRMEKSHGEVCRGVEHVVVFEFQEIRSVDILERRRRERSRQRCLTLLAPDNALDLRRSQPGGRLERRQYVRSRRRIVQRQARVVAQIVLDVIDVQELQRLTVVGAELVDEVVDEILLLGIRRSLSALEAVVEPGRAPGPVLETRVVREEREVVREPAVRCRGAVSEIQLVIERARQELAVQGSGAGVRSALDHKIHDTGAGVALARVACPGDDLHAIDAVEEQIVGAETETGIREVDAVNLIVHLVHLAALQDQVTLRVLLESGNGKERGGLVRG